MEQIMDTPADQNPGTDTTPPPAALPAPTVTFSQDDVNRMMGERAAQAKAAAAAEFASQLGVPLDEAKAIIERASKAEKDAMTEAERLAAEAQTDRDAAAADRAAARSERMSATVESVLTTEGIADPATRTEVAVLVVAKLDVAAEVTVEDVQAAVASVKTALPSLFQSPSRPPSGDPRAAIPPSGSPNHQGAAERGAARAAAFQGLTP